MTTIYWNPTGNGHISQTSRGQLDNKAYASMLNGLTSGQLKTEKAALEKLVNGVCVSSADRAEAKQKLNLVNKELASRPANGNKRCMLNKLENISREQIQKECAKKSTPALQSELTSLYAQRTQEQQMASQLRGMGANVKSQFDSNYDKDSLLEKKIGAIEAELSKRGASACIIRANFGQAVNALHGQGPCVTWGGSTAQTPMPPYAIPDLPPGFTLGGGTTTQPPAVTAPQTQPPAVAAPQTQPPAVSFEKQVVDHLQQFKQYFHLLDTAATKKDGLVDKKDLQKILNNPGMPQGLKDACKFFLDNNALFRELDLASGAKNFNNKFNQHGLNNMMKRYEAMIPASSTAAPAATTATSSSSTAATQGAAPVTQPTQTAAFTYQDAIRTLSNNFDAIKTSWGKDAKGEYVRLFTEHDLQNIVKNPSGYSADLVNAAKFLVENKIYLNMLNETAKSLMASTYSGGITQAVLTSEAKRINL